MAGPPELAEDLLALRAVRPGVRLVLRAVELATDGAAHEIVLAVLAEVADQVHDRAGRVGQVVVVRAGADQPDHPGRARVLPLLEDARQALPRAQGVARGHRRAPPHLSPNPGPQR